MKAEPREGSRRGGEGEGFARQVWIPLPGPRKTCLSPVNPEPGGEPRHVSLSHLEAIRHF